MRLPLRPPDRSAGCPRHTRGAADGPHLRRGLDREDDANALPQRQGHLRHARGYGQAEHAGTAWAFYIRDRLTGFAPGSIYGPLAFGTSALSNVETDWPGGGVIGIHGTNEPSLIPGHPSHGCIRVPNWEIVQLGRLLPIGTPLTIE